MTTKPLEQIAQEAADWIMERLPVDGSGEIDFTRLEVEQQILAACEKVYKHGYQRGVRDCSAQPQRSEPTSLLGHIWRSVAAQPPAREDKLPHDWNKDLPVITHLTPPATDADAELEKKFEQRCERGLCKGAALFAKASKEHDDKVRKPLVEALRIYHEAMDALYNHNEATRKAVVTYFGTAHPQAAIDALAKVGK
jgi:hypothetical protein